MKSRLATAALAVFCVLGTGACTSAVRTGDDTVRIRDVAPAADVGRIVCAKDAIHVETPVVRTHRDGVRFVLENAGGVWGLMFHAVSWDYGQAEGVTFHGDVTNDTSAMPPGSVTVACLPTRHASYDDPEATTATITIVDPDRLYVPWDLTCGFGEQSRITISAGEDPTEAFRRVPGVRPSDEFRTPNYPKSPQYSPTFNVYRDGTAVARIMGPWIEGEWKLLVNACPGSGIAGT